MCLRRRSCSIDNSPCSSNTPSPLSLKKDICRSESLRVVTNPTHRIFRASDLIHGEVLGKGCFGQAIKVSTHSLHSLTHTHTHTLSSLHTHTHTSHTHSHSVLTTHTNTHTHTLSVLTTHTLTLYTHSHTHTHTHTHSHSVLTTHTNTHTHTLSVPYTVEK